MRKVGQRTTRPKERKGVAVVPHNTLRLMEACGVTRAAKEMGTSTTTLHKARKSNLISKPLELAAGGILRELGGDGQSQDYEAVQQAQPKRTPPSSTMFLVEVPPDKADLVRKVVEMAHGKLIEP